MFNARNKHKHNTNFMKWCLASQLMEELTAHAQSDSLKDAREICAEGTYFPNNLRKRKKSYKKCHRKFKSYFPGDSLPVKSTGCYSLMETFQGTRAL